MTPEPLVDLLLVRLGREEEKKRVSQLLVTSLQMTEGDANSAVENSPVVLREAVPMAEARDIQKKLYPFIDLLPRIDETTMPPPPPPAREGQADDRRASPGEAKPSYHDEHEGLIDGHIVSNEYIDSIGTPEPDDDDDFTSGAVIEHAHSRDSSGETARLSTEVEDDMLITSASEEMLQIDRCHVCGRTPQDGEKLAPCRTCGELTCRDCFDRTVHVCEKCAEEGKVISSPLQGAPDYLSKHDHHLDQETSTSPGTPAPKGGGGFPKVLIPVVIVLGLAAAFYLVDPMHLFGPAEDGNGLTVPVDTTAVADSATVVRPDTTGPVTPDTLETPPDSVQAVEELPLGLASLTLPDTLEIPSVVPRIDRITRFGSSAVSVDTEGLGVLAPPIEQIAAVCGIKVDEISLVDIDDGTKLLLLSVLHPEDNTYRYHFLNHLAGFLLGSDIDQLVFYYRENRFQTTSILTYTSESFSELRTSTSPQQFQQLAGSLGGEVWELVQGSLMETLTASGD